jgi:hypothetical protein
MFSALMSADSILSMTILPLCVAMLFNYAVSISNFVTLNGCMLVNTEMWTVLRSGRDVV